MAKPRHQRDTKTFDGLSFSEQAKSISAQLANLGRAITRHARHDFAVASFPSTIGTFDSLLRAEQVAREYLFADAKGVWIQYPDLTRRDMKAEVAR